MTPHKKGQQYEIRYRCSGYTKEFCEYFPTLKEANLRAAEIKFEKSKGTFRPPLPFLEPVQKAPQKQVTVSELLDEYVQVYGLNHWGDSYLSMSQHRIEHYIKPYIGDVLLRDLTTHDLDLYFTSLRDKPAVILKGHKQTEKTVSPAVIEKTHALLRNALNQAMKWGYISANPAELVSLPSYRRVRRDVWSASEAHQALELCTDPLLKLTMQLALGCSLRIGEILGLTWDCVDCSDESQNKGTAFVYINKQLKRCQKDCLESLDKRGRSRVVLTFPEWKKTGSTTSLVLTAPKTESSVRHVYLPKTVALALQKARKEQNEQKRLLGPKYQDFDLVIAHNDGRPYESHQIEARLKQFTRENGLPPVVFHSLRHCSASIKLQIGGGNIKAVQGDTGHAQARMVTDLYAHTHNEDRRNLARRFEEDFFQKPENKADENSDMSSMIQLLQENPDVARLLLAIMDKKSTA